MAELKEIISLIECIAPLELAESWDNSGLQIGNPKSSVKKIGISLDADLDILKKCSENGTDLLITHHPLFFSKLKSINLSDVQGKIISEAIKNDIAVYSAHTSLDSAYPGLNDYLLEKLNLTPDEPILSSGDNSGKTGLGRIAVLEKEMTCIEFARTIKDKLSLKYLRIIGNEDLIIRKIGVCTGSGASLIRDARSRGADLFLTGDMKYHEAKDAIDQGIPVIDAGHFGTEIIACELIEEKLKKLASEKGYEMDYIKFISEDVFKIL